MNYRIPSTISIRLLTFAWVIFFLTGTHIYAESQQPDKNGLEKMQQNFAEFRQARESGQLELPFMLQSVNNLSDSHAGIRYFLDDVSLNQLRDKLSQPAEWCEFIPLHLNIKACGHFQNNGKSYVQFYAGTKGYLTPDKAHLLQLKFTSLMLADVYTANLFAADGPLDSSNIQFDIRAIDVSEDQWQGVYLEFDLSSEPGLAAGLARIYLATVARKKIGFSKEGSTWSGKPAYVGGQRGATERNIVRYLLAIESYFSTLNLPPEKRFQARLERWFDATEQFRPQLYEMSRKEYIANKKAERKNMKILQQALDRGEKPEYGSVDKRH